jgi:hypothetical protein
MAQEVPADSIGDEWKGYVFRITGGNDKQGGCLFHRLGGLGGNWLYRIKWANGISLLPFRFPYEAGSPPSPPSPTPFVRRSLLLPSPS